MSEKVPVLSSRPALRPVEEARSDEPLPRIEGALRKPAAALPPGFCKPSDRAPAGQRRYRVRAEIPGGNHPARYVLAKDKQEAEALYVKNMKLEAEAAMRAKNGDPVFRIVTVQLAD